MIVQLKGNVKYPITLDPTVWIFDDRRVELANAFDDSKDDQPSKKENSRMTKEEREAVLSKSFCIALSPFLETAEPNESATIAVLHTKQNGKVEIELEALRHSLAVFSKEGKPLKEDGPIQLIYGDGSNKDNPIIGIEVIEIK